MSPPPRFGNKLVARLAAVVAAAASVTLPSSADILIVSSSNAPSLKPGAQLADSAQLEVPAGAKVRVLLPSGATLTINGPASRPVRDVTKGAPLVESVWVKAKELLATGGVDQTQLGAARSMIAKPGAAPAGQFAWTLIDATARGNVCIERGAPLGLARPGSTVGEATVTDTTAKTTAKVAWAEGASRAAWPTTLIPNVNTTYQIVTASQPPRTIRLRLVDKAATGEANALRTLLDNDCLQQARTWMQ